LAVVAAQEEALRLALMARVKQEESVVAVVVVPTTPEEEQRGLVVLAPTVTGIRFLEVGCQLVFPFLPSKLSSCGGGGGSGWFGGGGGGEYVNVFILISANSCLIDSSHLNVL